MGQEKTQQFLCWPWLFNNWWPVHKEWIRMVWMLLLTHSGHNRQ